VVKTRIYASGKQKKQGRILVVEDHKSLRETLQDWLSFRFPDVEVDVAATGEEAVTLSTRTNPDLILMDIRLPGIDGFEATREILKRGVQTEVIIITNHNEEIYQQESQNAGARGFVLKRNIWERLPVVISTFIS